MGDNDSAPAAPPAASALTNQPDEDPVPRPAVAAQRQATPPSTPSNENTAHPSGTDSVQPSFLHQLVSHNQQQQLMPYQAQQQMLYQAQQMPYQAQQQMLYQAQQMPYQAQQSSPYQYAAHFHPCHCSQNAATSSEASTSVSYGWSSPQPSSSRAPTPAQLRRPTRKVGRTRKYPLPEQQDDDPAPFRAAAAGSGPCVVDIPTRDEDDVCVGQSKAAKCATCTLWVGRYILEPCYHHGFCISCLEVNANIDKAQNKEPACPSCDTTISKYVPGIRVTIMDLNYGDN